MAEQLALQPKGGGSSPTSPLQYHISKIPHDEARDFVEKWHYSKRIPTGKNICYGLRRRGQLYAVIVYGIGVNPYQAQFLGVNICIELKRMCRIEPREDYSLSRFVNLTTRMLSKQIKFDAIVAFADPEYGHEGTVYKAAGYTHHGMTNAEWHLEDADGNKRHRRFAFRMARRNDISIHEARERLNVSRIQTAPKHRWVRFLNKATTDSTG